MRYITNNSIENVHVMGFNRNIPTIIGVNIYIYDPNGIISTMLGGCPKMVS